MPLLDQTGWKTDGYTREEPGAAGVIVTLEGLEAALEARLPDQRIGVDIPNNTVPSSLASVQDQLDLISIDFPIFKDGRGFSLARMLRVQGFKGTLRANGKITPDQFHFALRCGFDEVELSEEQAARQPIEQWLRAPQLFSVRYQDDRDGIVPIFRQRRAAAR